MSLSLFTSPICASAGMLGQPSYSARFSRNMLVTCIDALHFISNEIHTHKYFIKVPHRDASSNHAGSRDHRNVNINILTQLCVLNGTHIHNIIRSTFHWSVFKSHLTTDSPSDINFYESMSPLLAFLNAHRTFS